MCSFHCEQYKLDNVNIIDYQMHNINNNKLKVFLENYDFWKNILTGMDKKQKKIFDIWLIMFLLLLKFS